jgi:hypothetical protein
MANTIGIPDELISSKQVWETTLDTPPEQIYWLMKPSTAPNWVFFLSSVKIDNNKWRTSADFSRETETNWTWELRKSLDNSVIDSGGFSLVVVLTSLESQLNAVKQAISALITAKPVQSYSIRGRSLSYYSLAELRSLKSELEAEIALKANGAGGRFAKIAFRNSW